MSGNRPPSPLPPAPIYPKTYIRIIKELVILRTILTSNNLETELSIECEFFVLSNTDI